MHSFVRNRKKNAAADYFGLKTPPLKYFPVKSDHADSDYKAALAFWTLQSPFHWYTKQQKSSLSGGTLGHGSPPSEGTGQQWWHHASITVCVAAQQRAMGPCRSWGPARAPVCFFHQCNWRGTHNKKQQKSGTQPNCPPKILQGLLYLRTAHYLVLHKWNWNRPTPTANRCYLTDCVMLFN